MAEPVWRDADGQGYTGPDAPGRPLPGWGSVQRLLMTAVEATCFAVRELEASPGCPEALRRAELLNGSLIELLELARSLRFDEKTLERLVAERVAEELAARRGRLSVVPR